MSSVDTRDLLEEAVRAAADKKAFQIVALDVAELTSYADNFLLCSAASDRQVGAIVHEVGRRLRDLGRRPLHVEGSSRSEWVLLDYGDVVVHVFTEEKRAYYGLDNLWGDAVRIEQRDSSVGDDESPESP